MEKSIVSKFCLQLKIITGRQKTNPDLIKFLFSRYNYQYEKILVYYVILKYMEKVVKKDKFCKFCHITACKEPSNKNLPNGKGKNGML